MVSSLIVVVSRIYTLFGTLISIGTTSVLIKENTKESD